MLLESGFVFRSGGGEGDWIASHGIDKVKKKGKVGNLVIVELSGSMDMSRVGGGHASYVHMCLRSLSALLPSQYSYIPQISSSQASTILNLDTCVGAGLWLSAVSLFHSHPSYCTRMPPLKITSGVGHVLVAGKKCPKQQGSWLCTIGGSGVHWLLENFFC